MPVPCSGLPPTRPVIAPGLTPGAGGLTLGFTPDWPPTLPGIAPGAAALRANPDCGRPGIRPGPPIGKASAAQAPLAQSAAPTAVEARKIFIFRCMICLHL